VREGPILRQVRAALCTRYECEQLQTLPRNISRFDPNQKLDRAKRQPSARKLSMLEVSADRLTPLRKWRFAMNSLMLARLVVVLAIALLAGVPQFGRAADPGLRVPTWLADRGEGIPTSLFGTYVREKELLFYPFYEYTKYKNYEYSPKDFKVSNSDREFFGKATIHEALIFLAYGFTDSLALEFESAAYTRAPRSTFATDT
jgi:hypothetical protein